MRGRRRRSLQAGTWRLRHREKLAFQSQAPEQQVLELTLAMTEVNSKLIEVNERVMETNEGIVHFNAQYISQNSWIAKGLDLDSVTPASLGCRRRTSA